MSASTAVYWSSLINNNFTITLYNTLFLLFNSKLPWRSTLLPLSSSEHQLFNLNKKPHHASILMRHRLSSISKLTYSQRPLILDTGPMFLTSPVPSRPRVVLPHILQYILGNSSIKLSPSQELEDTHMFKKTWTCSNISRITLTPTSATQWTWPTSSRLPTQSRKTLTPNTTTVSSLTQLSVLMTSDHDDDLAVTRS